LSLYCLYFRHLHDPRTFPTRRSSDLLFVSVVDQKVYLIHQTAREFLVAKNEVLAGRWKHSLDPVGSDLLMARICVTYLMFTAFEDRKSTRLNSSHLGISYAVFCLKKN